MKYRLLLPMFLLLAGLLTPAAASSAGPEGGSPWYQQDGAGGLQVNLYFFWSANCPHCQEARPVVERMAEELPWLVLHSRELSRHSSYQREYMTMARLFGQEARSVPAFFFCGRMLLGFDNEAGIGAQIRNGLEQCRQQLLAGQPPTQASALEGLELPLFGTVAGGEHSLLLVTAVIAALDAFNPCAFFVLLFLLSLLIHTRSRRRMLFIGGVFIFFSAAIYFLFMSAWLNLFLLLGMQRLFTLGAGAVAVAIALINIKDFFLPGRGVSLSIAEEKKPGLFQRTRALLQADNLLALTLGTVALALAANSYELLCTSGLPMVYTRILTLEALPSTSYYFYLLLYNVIYVVPLLLILLLFTFTLGQRKLQPQEGRLLKLLSGVMMLELGLGLLLLPQLLGSVAVIAAGMFSAILLTLAGWYGLRLRGQRG
jgi:hypothetical protein